MKLTIFQRGLTATVLSIFSLGLVPNLANAEMFLLDRTNPEKGWALNVWRDNPNKFDGYPPVDVFRTDTNDVEQIWDRLSGQWGGLWKARGTGSGTNYPAMCINAHYLWNGANVNIYPCNANDPDQNWTIVSYDSDYQPSFGIRRTLPDSNGRYYCLSASNLTNGRWVSLKVCNQNDVTQRWKTLDDHLPF